MDVIFASAGFVSTNADAILSCANDLTTHFNTSVTAYVGLCVIGVVA